MSKTEFAVRRILQGIPTLFGLSIIIFVITRIIPGDPVRAALGPDASTEQVEQMRREMGLDEPIYVQYINWLTGVFQGDWGMSVQTRNNVLEDIIVRFPATFELVTLAMLFAVLLAIPIGVIAGTNRDRWPDNFSRTLAFIGVSMPRFWIAILFQVVFFGMLSLLPLSGRLSRGVERPPHVTGMYLVDSLIAGQPAVFIDALSHIALPAIALGLATMAEIARYIRSDMIEESQKDYVLAAKAYGLPTNLIQYKYMLKNAFSSALTIIGLAFGFLMGSAFLVELVFDWPGMARYGVEAILFTDFNAIVGITIVVGIIYVLVNIVVDILYGYLDPRITYGGEN